MKNLLYLCLAVILFFACNNNKAQNNTITEAEKTPKPVTDSVQSKTTGTASSAAEMMQRKQVPILCYHHIVDAPSVGKNSAGYTVTVSAFKEQMKALADSGYKSISPDQLYAYLNYNEPLPEKPVMITYDDTDEEQFSIAKPEMDKYGFKGVYFIMTISIGRPRYMSKEQIKQLSDEGHTIASHTWDHSRFDRYAYENTKEIGGKKKLVNDYDLQLADTKKKLEEITGKKVEHFAYPFGIWDAKGIPELQKRGYKTAYQLATKRDSLQPLFTARRILVAPQWGAQGLIKVMNSSFK